MLLFTRLYKQLCTIDFIILDKIYSPLAHWIYDQFDIKANQVGKICLVGLPISALTDSKLSSLLLKIFLIVMVATVITVEYSRPSSRFGFDNIRRYVDQPTRIFWIANMFLMFLETMGNFHIMMWWVTLLSSYYFSAVRERPRKPKKLPQVVVTIPTPA
jgi:hypothetical protein